MRLLEEIDAAIAAHGMWKARLKKAIDTGTIDVHPDTIRVDDQCAFGKWLHGPTITAADKASRHYQVCHDLHAAFHEAAARVAELALAGRKQEAERSLGLGGEYAVASATLTKAMIEWKESVLASSATAAP